MADVPSQAVTRCHRLSQGLSQAVTGCHRLSQAVTDCHRLSQGLSQAVTGDCKLQSGRCAPPRRRADWAGGPRRGAPRPSSRGAWPAAGAHPDSLRGPPAVATATDSATFRVFSAETLELCAAIWEHSSVLELAGFQVRGAMGAAAPHTFHASSADAAAAAAAINSACVHLGGVEESDTMAGAVREIRRGSGCPLVPFLTRLPLPFDAGQQHPERAPR